MPAANTVQRDSGEVKKLRVRGQAFCRLRLQLNSMNVELSDFK